MITKHRLREIINEYKLRDVELNNKIGRINTDYCLSKISEEEYHLKRSKVITDFCDLEFEMLDRRTEEELTEIDNFYIKSLEKKD